MKFDFDKIIRFLSKHKLAVFLAVFLAFILLFRTRLVIEGLTTIGEYEYLAPLPPNNTISDDVMKAYLDKVMSPQQKQNIPPDYVTNVKKSFQTFVTEKELQYHTENGKWPYDSYVLNYLTAHPEVLQKPNMPNNSLELTQMRNPNRNAYEIFIAPIESQMTPPPLSYQIYMGTAEPPSEMMSLPGISSSSSSSTSMDPNYQDFLSLCKRVLNK